MSGWRVGRKLGRTLYVGDQLVGMMDTPELAASVVAAMSPAEPMTSEVNRAWRMGAHHEAHKAEVESLKKQLAASIAREAQLRAALKRIVSALDMKPEIAESGLGGAVIDRAEDGARAALASAPGEALEVVKLADERPRTLNERLLALESRVAELEYNLGNTSAFVDRFRPIGGGK